MNRPTKSTLTRLDGNMNLHMTLLDRLSGKLRPVIYKLFSHHVLYRVGVTEVNEGLIIYVKLNDYF